jgi:DNA invertase Pin-like site-specific DNA recombinase
MLSIFGAMAQFEREVMLERQRAGIAKAKTEGKYRGRAPTARRRLAEMQALRAEGLAAAEIGRRLGLPRQTVHRILREAQQ